MTDEQIKHQVSQNTAQIAAMTESLKSAHKRIDESCHIIGGIHEISASVKGLSIQIKHLSDKLDGSISGLESSIRRQGERIGALEAEPGSRWKTVTMQAVAVVVAGVLGFILTKLL